MVSKTIRQLFFITFCPLYTSQFYGIFKYRLTAEPGNGAMETQMPLNSCNVEWTIAISFSGKILKDIHQIFRLLAFMFIIYRFLKHWCHIKLLSIQNFGAWRLLTEVPKPLPMYIQLNVYTCLEIWEKS